MVDYKITKRTKLLEVNNDMAHNYYYLVQGKIYNENKTRFRRFKLVVFFVVFDLMEWHDKDNISKNEILEYINELVDNDVMIIRDYNDIEGLKRFYDLCNNTIKNYNNFNGRL